MAGSSAEGHDRVARLLREGGPLAPPALRARVEAEVARADERRGLRIPVMGVAFAGAAATLAIALALFLPGILSGGDPTVSEAHGLSAAGSTGAAPAEQQGAPALLAADVEGVAFPDWEPEFGWRAVGQRSDGLDGRSTKTVFYEHQGHTIAYTIVSGDALDPAAGAKRVTVNGVELYMTSDDHGHDIVSFVRDGRTCVLSGHVLHRSTLRELAAWQGDGSVTF